ncbi:MAG: YicC/YloC family endoribonuclease [bacterium]
MPESSNSIYSMTGFGRGEAEAKGIRVGAEIRCLNNRYFDFLLRAPRSLQNYESELRELCRRQIERGRVTLVLSETRSASAPPALHFDANLAANYAKQLESLSKSLGLKDEVKLAHLIAFPELLAPAEDAELSQLLLRLASEATERALTDLQQMRAAEGQVLADDMKNRLQFIGQTIEEIEQYQQGLPARTLEKMKERLSRLSLPDNFDEYRLELELALLVDRMDITEECVRLRSHLAQGLETLEKPPVGAGKRIGFILQELNREANTIASKTGCLDISRLTIRIREELEKLREQVQNIE